MVGTTPVAQALETLGSGVGLAVELTDGESARPRADDAALIVASHGKAEEVALEAALRAGVPYVALVASGTRGAAVLESLDVDQAQRSASSPRPGCSWAPAPPARSRCRSWPSSSRSGRSPGTPPRRRRPRCPRPVSLTGAETAAADAPATAIDPVCGMTVAAAESSLQLEHNGVTVYFCSPGCRAAFRKDPERYALTL